MQSINDIFTYSYSYECKYKLCTRKIIPIRTNQLCQRPPPFQRVASESNALGPVSALKTLVWTVHETNASDLRILIEFCRHTETLKELVDVNLILDE